MKYLYVLFLVVAAAWGCQDVKVGCLDTSNAEYSPDTMLVRKELATSLAEAGGDITIYRNDRNRKTREASWVTPQIQGIVGTAPLSYSLYEVRAMDGGDAEIFKQELTVRGGGIMEVPYIPESPNGRYIVSLKVENDEYSAILEDVFTFVIRQSLNE